MTALFTVLILLTGLLIALVVGMAFTLVGAAVIDRVTGSNHLQLIIEDIKR